MGVTKLYNLYAGRPYILVTDSPYFFLSLTTMVIGCQLFLTGFIGELVVRNSSSRNHYEIKQTIKSDL
ncbi:MAG: hypothetical protein K2M01_03990 [Paramuribaculum sp.]|nr:hypothetical protein [Paramuribaculum sp.]